MDRRLLQRTLHNLIENALRHGAEDGRIDITLTPDGVLRVVNDGPVVPPEVLSRLTARFERGGAGNEGSGLGLFEGDFKGGWQIQSHRAN